MAGRKPLIISGPQVEQIPDGDFVQLGKLNLGPPESIDVTSNTISITKTHVEIASLTNQNLIQINGGEDNDLLLLRGALVTNRIRIKSTGNIRLKKNRDIEGIYNILLLLRFGGLWYEVSWSG